LSRPEGPKQSIQSILYFSQFFKDNFAGEEEFEEWKKAAAAVVIARSAATWQSVLLRDAMIWEYMLPTFGIGG
jgi:hypothetical protein